MLPFSKLSFWERSIYTQEIDFAVIGAGIVGMSSALYLRKAHPKAKICILERGYLPTGASTKNAGFTCFGSPTELHDDLGKMNENTVWETIAMRIEGLQELFTLVDPNRIDYQATGSWDLLLNDEKPLPDSLLEYLNENIFKINGIRNTYSKDKAIIKSSGFEGIGTAYYNKLEGAIHTGKLITELHRLCVMDGIHFLFGIDVLSFESFSDHVEIQSNHGSLKSTNLLVCTNAFAQDYLPDISPARAQVLITKPIKNLNIQGTFHMNAGYYYFRNIGDRLLFGGGRHLDIQGETSTEFESSEIIQSELRRILSANLLPKSPFEIDYTWSGIMGVGTEKKPIIQKTNKNTAFGVRMGGMGVAIGASVGKKLSNLFL